jgi:hypothetical protein
VLVDDTVGTQIHIGGRAVFVLKATNAPTGGVAQSLLVDVQHSVDDGQTWTDFAALSLTSAGTVYYPISSVCSPSTIGNPSGGIIDGGSSLPAPNGYQGPIGNRFRIRYNATLGTSTGPWAFQVYVLPHLNPIKDHMQ